MIYKILSIILCALFVVAGGFYFYEKYSHNKTRQELENKISFLEKIVKETEDVYSKKAQEYSNLESKNKELQQLIDKRNEKIAALTEINIQLKNQIIEFQNVTQTVIGDPLDGVDCEGCEHCINYCVGKKRYRVDFSEQKDYLKISGYCFTNPPEATVQLEYIRSIKLGLVLTKDKDNNFRVYMDTNTSDLVPSELSLTVDPDALNYKWYQRIGVGLGVGIGDGMTANLNAFYSVFDDIFVGPSFFHQYDGLIQRKFFGINMGFYPFR